MGSQRPHMYSAPEDKGVSARESRGNEKRVRGVTDSMIDMEKTVFR